MPGISAATVAASAARTTNGNSGSAATPAGQNLAVLVNVTASSGTTPSLALTVEWSHDGTNFAQADTADAFTAITANGAKVKAFPVKGEFFRLVWAITGTTPSFTFAATAYGV